MRNLAWLGCLALAFGCGGEASTPTASNPPAPKKPSANTRPNKATNKASNAKKTSRKPNSQSATANAPKSTREPSKPGVEGAPATSAPGGPTLDPSLLATTSKALSPQAAAPTPPPFRPPLTSAEAKTQGFRRLDGEHIVLYTDLPSSPGVDELPKIYDLAVPQWCKYFGVDPATVKGWKQSACLMQNKERFLRAGLLPRNMPPFLHGFQRGEQLWLYDQPTDYYRRHLLLHEGVHAFMNWRYQGCGPPWYMEGMAELLGTHQWKNGKLTIGYSPRSKAETPHWGRVKIIQDDFRGGRALTLDKVLSYGPRAHLNVEPYGWSWAASIFFDRHPAYQSAFRGMWQFGQDTSGAQFNAAFLRRLGAKLPQAELEWMVYVADMQYGYDIARNAIEFSETRALPATGAEVEVQAERGWQSTGFRLQAGKTYRLVAAGRFQIAKDAQPWIAEPNGVTIRYHQRRPMGRLLAAVEDWKQPARPTTLIRPLSIGTEGLVKAERDGDLFLQLNDSPAERFDNSGAARVRITLAVDEPR